MTDKEMLDWVEANLTMLTQLEDDNFGMDYIDADGKHQAVVGSSLRDCIQKANPISIDSLVEFQKQLCNVETEKLFEYGGYPMKAVQVGDVTCKGCDFYHEACVWVNDTLEEVHGHRCGAGWHIMFVNQKDKDEHFAY